MPSTLCWTLCIAYRILYTVIPAERSTAAASGARQTKSRSNSAASSSSMSPMLRGTPAARGSIQRGSSSASAAASAVAEAFTLGGSGAYALIF
jgi:hypothetical protein